MLSSQRPPEADRPSAEKLGSRLVPASAGGGSASGGKAGIHTDEEGLDSRFRWNDREGGGTKRFSPTI